MTTLESTGTTTDPAAIAPGSRVVATTNDASGGTRGQAGWLLPRSTSDITSVFAVRFDNEILNGSGQLTNSAIGRDRGRSLGIPRGGSRWYVRGIRLENEPADVPTEPAPTVETVRQGSRVRITRCAMGTTLHVGQVGTVEHVDGSLYDVRMDNIDDVCTAARVELVTDGAPPVGARVRIVECGRDTNSHVGAVGVFTRVRDDGLFTVTRDDRSRCHARRIEEVVEEVTTVAEPRAGDRVRVTQCCGDSTCTINRGVEGILQDISAYDGYNIYGIDGGVSARAIELVESIEQAPVTGDDAIPAADVVDMAMKLAGEHGWCTEFVRALEEAGIRPVAQLDAEVTMTFRVKLESTGRGGVRTLCGYNNDSSVGDLLSYYSTAEVTDHPSNTAGKVVDMRMAPTGSGVKIVDVSTPLITYKHISTGAKR